MFNTSKELSDFFNAVKIHILASTYILASKKKLLALYKAISKFELLKKQYLNLFIASDLQVREHVILLIEKFTLNRIQLNNATDHLILMELENNYLNILFSPFSCLCRLNILEYMVKTPLSEVNFLRIKNKTDIYLLMGRIEKYFPDQIFKQLYPFSSLDENLLLCSQTQEGEGSAQGELNKRMYVLLLNSSYKYIKTLIPNLLKCSSTPTEFFKKLCIELAPHPDTKRKSWFAICILIAARRAEKTSQIFTSIFNLIPVILDFMGEPTLVSDQCLAARIIIHCGQYYPAVSFSLEQKYLQLFFQYTKSLKKSSYLQHITSFIQKNGKPSEEKYLIFQKNLQTLGIWIGKLASLKSDESKEHELLIDKYNKFILNSPGTPIHNGTILNYVTSYTDFPSLKEYQALEEEVSTLNAN